ncbi:Uncharacterised protein [Bordetella pertussis]|nr:Uncharacterised protein [Bordetella pertussis]CFW10350.1 Uncharacterised protein [Bordetella pertussis]
MPFIEKSPSLTLKSPAPSTRVTAATIRLRLSLKSTWLTTQMRAPAMAIRPNTTTDMPPSTGPGMVWISAPNLGENPSTSAITAATTNTSVE